MAKPTIALVGAGNLARALARALQGAGYRVTTVVARNRAESRRRARVLARQVQARVLSRQDAIPGDILWICVTDDAIASTAAELAAKWNGRIALHSSGALTSDLLTPLRRRGAAVASLHPMMTFVGRSSPSLSGISFAVEGDPAAVRVARRIARDLGGSVFDIAKEGKTLYHAMGSFSSPLLIASLAMAEQVGQAAGLPRRSIPRIMQPLLRQTLENYFRGGAARAFSGPIVRADVETVRRHLRALKKVPGARDIYLALARSALDTLPVRNRSALRKILK
ncbi:MAG: DUF2520 domain-containing protein [Acidobacteriia bacterium]|nr:DUF2520 domain-containing protein [Terriglobia bacterium]